MKVALIKQTEVQNCSIDDVSIIITSKKEDEEDYDGSDVEFTQDLTKFDNKLTLKVNTTSSQG